MNNYERWLAVKETEDRMRQERHAIEKQIIDAVDLPLEGTKSFQHEDLKIKITTSLKRELDLAAYNRETHGMPQVYHTVEMVPKLVTKKVKALDQLEPGFTARYITTSPRKPQIKIERIEADES